MRHDGGLQTIINASSANDTLQIESSDDLPLPISNGSRDYCFTSPSANPSIRIKTKVARALAGPDKITMGIMEEEEEVEQLSPNTVLEVMASTPTSSSSIHHEEFAWVSSSSRGKDLSDSEVKKLRIMSESLHKSPQGSFACVHTNRRKSRPRRSPII